MGEVQVCVPIIHSSQFYMGELQIAIGR